MTDLQVLVFTTILNDIAAGTIVGILAAFAIVVMRRN
jgi:uncharacterized membrane protein (Fun14 family)